MPEKYTPATIARRRKEFSEKKQTEVASWPDTIIQKMQLQGGVAGQCARPYELRTGESGEEYKEPYCRECGSEDMAYLEEYANGREYKCRVCGTVQMW
jgi:hypothetical protein